MGLKREDGQTLAGYVLMMAPLAVVVALPFAMVVVLGL